VASGPTSTRGAGGRITAVPLIRRSCARVEDKMLAAERGTRMWKTGATLLVAFLSMSSAGAQERDPLGLYGGDVVFEIVRNGTSVGEQRVSFEVRPDGALVAREISDIVVRILGIAVYRFHYEGVGVWRAGQLEELQATTNDDGTMNRVTVHAGDGRTLIEGTAGRFDVPRRLLAGAHWNADVLRQTELINTITGKVDQVSIQSDGSDPIAVPGGQVAAKRFVYKGDLDFTAWYDDAGRWVALRFAGKDGSVIDYKCRRCGAAH
jgi:hypothetical protein